MLKILPDMVRLDKEEMASIPSFCSYINTSKDNLSDYQKTVIANYIISNVVGININEMNIGIYRFFDIKGC